MENVEFSWEIRASVIKLKGIIDENSSFDDLKPQIAGPVAFDLSNITKINSCGVREWIWFMEQVQGLGPHRLLRCPPSVVYQLNVVSNFSCQATVESVLGPFVCDSCLHECLAEIDTSAAEVQLPEVKCPKCGEEMEFDDIETRYLLFRKYT